MTTKVRESLLNYLRAKSGTIALGCYDGISARVVQNMGIPVAYLSGFCVAATMGKPDMGIVSLHEMAARAKCITDSISIPLVADADNGYGGPVNIAETVRLFEDAGVAGLHLEDQPVPKRCAGIKDKKLVSKEEMVARVKTALDARRDEKFTIIARTDAMLVNDLDDAVERMQAYEAAGADAGVIMSISTVEEMRRVTGSFKMPMLVMMAEHVRPLIAHEELRKLGFGLAVYPLSLMFSSIRTQKRVAATLAKSGSTAEVLDDIELFDDVNELLELKVYLQKEHDYQNYLTGGK